MTAKSERKKEISKFPSFKNKQVEIVGATEPLTNAFQQIVTIVESENVHEALEKYGINADFLAKNLKACIEATYTRTDKHGNAINTVDLKLRLNAIKVACMIRGDMKLNVKHSSETQAASLFGDVEFN